MNTRSKIASGLTAAAIAITAVGFGAMPTVASAQQQAYDSRTGTYYDPCVRSQTNRGTGGALIGGGLGAVAGSNIAGRGRKTEGAILGGVLGAVAGGVVGNKSAACNSQPQQGYYDDGRGGYAQEGYQGGYQSGGYAGDQYYDDRYARPAPVPAARCASAQNVTYMPDGTTEQTYVRVCRDSSGRYQVVD